MISKYSALSNSGARWLIGFVNVAAAIHAKNLTGARRHHHDDKTFSRF